MSRGRVPLLRGEEKYGMEEGSERGSTGKRGADIEI